MSLYVRCAIVVLASFVMYLSTGSLPSGNTESVAELVSQPQETSTGLVSTDSARRL